VTCPFPDSHRRLDDTHAEWHDALDAYFDPHKFRRTYNSFLTSVQSTIDTVSRKKRIHPEGQQILAAWEASVASDRIQRWADRARNLVVHEADLTLHSSAWTEYTDPAHDTVVKRLDVSPSTDNDEILSSFLMNKPENIRGGIVRVSRKWVANNLPDHELLEAGTRLYTNVARLVSAFHSDAADCSDLSLPSRECHPDSADFRTPACMNWTPQAPITRTIDVATRHELALKVRAIERDPTFTSETFHKHYGEYFSLHGDPIQVAPRHLRSASLFLTVDGEALPWMVLYKGAEQIDAFQLGADSAASKIAMFNTLAERVRTTGADGFMWTSEIWTPQGLEPQRKVHQHDETFYHVQPDRGEALVVAAATKDGRRLMMLRQFTRDTNGWPQLGRIHSFGQLSHEWGPVLAALNGLPIGSTFR
jgi:hypothetical protein